MDPASGAARIITSPLVLPTLGRLNRVTTQPPSTPVSEPNSCSRFQSERIGRSLSCNDCWPSTSCSFMGDMERRSHWTTGGSIVGDSALNHLLIAPPQHYEAQFVLDSGKVELLHVAGITERERDYAKEHGSEALLALLQNAGGFPVTNPLRSTVVALTRLL